jgi:hypothetical protein
VESRRVSRKAPEEIIANVTLNGSKHEFSFFDFEMLVASMSDAEKNKLSKDPLKAQIELVAQMFIRRYPYEDSEIYGIPAKNAAPSLET